MVYVGFNSSIYSRNATEISNQDATDAKTTTAPSSDSKPATVLFLSVATAVLVVLSMAFVAGRIKLTVRRKWRGKHVPPPGMAFPTDIGVIEGAEPNLRYHDDVNHDDDYHDDVNDDGDYHDGVKRTELV
ncbi:unnamed protein product [Pseudo-nitzschia multistriata]|uniref:Uncharacterized protein n=1 Tax=Pseudo-nitzschia multistriata TaxID=183589 RepID=A0A448Z4I5_9STRA|nr:unnamed protein product [Pseudo-nitzschia multistriata]